MKTQDCGWDEDEDPNSCTNVTKPRERVNIVDIWVFTGIQSANQEREGLASSPDVMAFIFPLMISSV